jgi:hypothetical protein
MKRNEFIKRSGALLAMSSMASPVKSSLISDDSELQKADSGRICTACGTQFSEPDREVCPICNDDRQYVPESGQAWTTLDSLSNNHSVSAKKINDNLYELRMTPSFAIGQRAFLVLSAGGNILWDCIPLLDKSTADFINSKGGLKAIAFSHPHYYSSMNMWAETFNCPIYIHEKDDQWIMNKGPRVILWQGIQKQLWDKINIINIGGHFPGSSVLQVPAPSRRGTLLCGDTLYISRSKKHIAVMHSYPNQIPLPLSEVNRIRDHVEGIEFDVMHGAFDFQNLSSDVKEIFSKSMKRYTV